jgi:D-alanine-D-alanine ligase
MTPLGRCQIRPFLKTGLFKQTIKLVLAETIFMKIIKLAVLMGGPSSEYDVSLASGENIIAGLDRTKYEVLSVRVTKGGVWQVPPEELRKKADLVFIAMHGEFGEDGTVQSILEGLGVPYTGSAPLPSALGMNKIFSDRLFRAHGLITPEAIIVNKNEKLKDLVVPFYLPVVVKPANRGSSVAVSVIRRKEDIIPAVKKAFEVSRDVIIQKYINGREVTCGALDDGRGLITSLAPTEIIPKFSNFFDYRSKYANNASEKATPPRLPAETIEKIKNTAAAAHRIIGASGMSRTDMIFSYEDNNLYVLEINTIPCMTLTSILPKEAAAMGISFSGLLDRIIQAALNRYGLSY